MAKAGPSRPRKRDAASIDDLMSRASDHLLKTDYFEAESLALQGLMKARTANDFERMARACLPLLEARRQRRMLAIDAGRFTRLSDEMGDVEVEEIEAGCYLFEPMLVAADARDLRERAMEQRVPVLALAREPQTELGRWPIAAIGPITVRTQVEAPAGGEPDATWLEYAFECLGDEAIAGLDRNRPGPHLVDQIVDRLGTVIDHEKLHQELEAACRLAHAEQMELLEGKPDAGDEAEDEADPVPDIDDIEADDDDDVV